MADAMETLARAWEDRVGPSVLATSDAAGTPNAIYVGEIRLDSREGFVVADNYFCKTRENVRTGKPGAVLFITKNRRSFQVKGTMTYHTSGPVFDGMKTWHDPNLPGVAAVVLRVREIYSGAERLL